jgi:hypothetical protein
MLSTPLVGSQQLIVLDTIEEEDMPPQPRKENPSYLQSPTMMAARVLLVGAFLLSTTAAQSSMAVPKDAPIPGDYGGPLRPQIHFSPPAKFMNDPNGMFIDAEGTYHLYYQC